MGVVPNVPILPGAGNAGSLVGSRDFRVYASEWGEPALILGGTPENSVAGRSRK